MRLLSKKSINLLTGLVLLLTVIAIGTAQASADGSFFPFVPADGSTVSGSAYGEFNYPGDVAVDSGGNVYVTDTNNDRIQKFDANGVFLTIWGSSGAGDGQFSTPNSVAVDSGGNVYVVDFNNNRIQKFDSNGVFLTKWGSAGSGDGQFWNPCGLAVYSGGYVYVADSSNDRIQKFDSNGVFITKWGSEGSGDGQFASPGGIAIDSLGNVYVADYNNNRIQKFDPTGVFITKWGSEGSGDGQFDRPCAVALDSAGNVYVADRFNDRIQKFDSNGGFLAKWGSEGSGGGQFNNPLDIAVDSGGNVYVADGSNNRIQVLAAHTLKATSTVKGQAMTGLGTPGSSLGCETAGSVTITAAQAADTTELAPYVTLFEGSDAVTTVKAVKYAAGGSTGGFGADTAYAGEAVSNDDFFIIRVTAADTPKAIYYKIIVTVNAPAEPVVQSATAGSSHVELSWSPVAGSTGYKVYMSTTSGSYGAALATVGGAVCSYDAAGLSNGATYYFVVRATNSGGDSANSNEVSATPYHSGGGGGGSSSAASNPTVTTRPAASISGTSASLQGNIASDGDALITDYGFFYGSSQSSLNKKAAAGAGNYRGDFSYDLTNLSAGETCFFRAYIINNKGRTVYGDILSFTTEDTGQQPVFTDVPASYWAYAAISKLKEQGLAGGYPDGTFRPDSAITRAEFATVLVKAFKLEARQGKYFADTAGHWAKDAISTAAAWGIISGYSDNEFGPDDPVTREQMAVMAANALKLSPADEVLSYSDSADIAAWARDAVAAVVKAGVMNGYPDNTFQPRRNATRAEAFTIIINALNK